MIKKILKYILLFGCIALMIIIFFEFKKYRENKPLCKNCDVLLISLDTLSAKHLPCYGYDKNTAPNLCQFAKDNILFTNSYSASHWTRPSQTSVLTGLYVSTHGVLTPQTSSLSPKYKTIQEILKKYGYKTYYYGPKPDEGSWDKSVIKNFDVNMSDEYSDMGVDKWNKALDILEENKKSRTPTFMYLHTYYVHDPYLFNNMDNLKYIKKEDIEKNSFLPITPDKYNKLTPEFKQYIIDSIKTRLETAGTLESETRLQKMLSYANKIKDTNDLFKSEEDFPSSEGYSLLQDWYFFNLEKSDPNFLASLYDETINKMDNELKPFFDRLSKDFSKDTIVIIYSDHGQTLGERGSVGHCNNVPNCLYNETVKVPLIFKVPGLKGKKIDEVVQGIDIYPTIVSMIGKQYPKYIEGENLSNLISGKSKILDRKFIVSEQWETHKVLIDKKWKIHFEDTNNINLDTIKLFDLSNDMWEQKNLAKNNPDVVKQKIEQLKYFLARNTDTNYVKSNFPDWIDNVKREKLTKQGYF